MQDDEIKARLKAAQQQATGEPPPFAHVWSAAERQAARQKPRYVVGGLGAVAAVALLAIALQPTGIEDAPELIDRQQLTASTRWVAPSDSLLPKRRFDIFSELPVLMESTGTEEGALL